jgi:hypothetical protein
MQKYRQPAACIGLLFILLLIQGKVYSQDAVLTDKVTLSLHQISVESLLDQITSIYHVNFSYNADIFSKKAKLDVAFINKPLREVLDNVLGQAYDYRILGKQIIITAKKHQLEKNDPPPSLLTVIKGYIYDSSTGEALPYASIAVKEGSIGTISNKDGDFMLKLIGEFSHQELWVSYIGYNTYVKKISEISNLNKLDISLQPVASSIKATIVRPTDPTSLIQGAISNIYKNYEIEPVFYIAFFREMIKKDNKYISISEAILNIQKSSYNHEYEKDEVKLYKARKNEDQKAMNALHFKVEGGILNTLKIDIARYYPSFMNNDFAEDYEYRFNSISEFEGKSVYQIDFDQKANSAFPLYRGSIYLDVDNLAIIGCHFSLSPKGIDYAYKMMIKKKPFHFQVKPLSAEYLVTYRQVGKKYQLNYIRSEVKVRAKARNSWFNSIYTTVSEMVITDKDTVIQPFKKDEIVKPRDILVEKIDGYDESFWADYNIIQPDITIEEAVAKIRSRLQSNSSGSEIINN